jgi:hypothetical protein
MTILEAHESIHLGIHRSVDGTIFDITAVSYVPQRGESAWRYIVLASSSEGTRRGFHCLIPQSGDFGWDDADFAVATDVFDHICCLLDGDGTLPPMISVVAGRYVLAEIDRRCISPTPLHRVFASASAEC